MTRMPLAPLAALLLCGAGCTRFGQVNQGRVVAYDKARGVVTLISDSNYRDPAHPRFDVLPAVSVRVPSDRREMGPEPASGCLMRLDWQNAQATYYHAASGSLRTAVFTPVDRRQPIPPDDSRVKGRRFPVYDRAAKTITVYSPSERALVVLSVSPELTALPEETWRVGDDVRYYYKDPAQALRLMNVTRTDLDKGGK